MNTVTNDFLYQQLANKIAQNIIDGVLKTGDKLPSVRTLSKDHGISLSTAFKTYVELENQGLIEARPKSGYYVRFAERKGRVVSSIPNTEKEPFEVNVDEMLATVYRSINKTGVSQLSMAIPALALLPESKLNKTMAEAIRENAYSCINYETIQGNLRLRQQIAKNALTWGGTHTADDIISTQGCMEALVFCLKAVAEPGDTIAIESPTYFGIFNVMKSQGLKVLEIPTDPQTGISIEYLEQAMEKVNIKACLFTPNFTNPLGCVMPEERKKQLVALLASKEIPLIEDDIYGDLFFGKSRPRTCKSYDENGLVLLCSSVSKSLAPGYRVGWCIPGKFKEKVLNTKLMHTISSATPTQAAIGLFFETGRFDLHMRNLRKALHTQCLRYLQAIFDYFPEETKVNQPAGGYVLWVELPPQINAFNVFRTALEQQIGIYPGQVFSTDGRFTNFIRISFGHPFNAEIDRSLKLLGQLIRSEANKAA